MPGSSDTIAAPATPAGVSALALIRVSGREAGRLVREIFGEAPPPRSLVRGDYCAAGGSLIDDVLFAFFAGPNSYTGEDTLEISAHGNPLIVHRILTDLFTRGCRPAEPGEFTRRAFLNGRMDLSQAEAVMDLIHAQSEKALAAAHRQLRGALSRDLRELADGLIEALARVEAYIDFPEEDLPPEDVGAVRRAVEQARRGAARLLATRRYGDALRDGIRTAIVGEPNAGKSSLFNRLVGRDRAIVSPEPGTTRDFIEERIAIGPHGLRLTDTAGLNPEAGALEKLGMEKTRECLEAADFVLLVLDATGPTPPGISALRLDPARALAVLNKTDLLSGPARAAPPAGLPAVAVSARTGAGLEQLEKAILRLAEGWQAEVGEESVAINARHAHALAQAEACLAAAAKQADSPDRPELLASDLRGALDALGEISGRIDHEQVLDRLFATFCIGK